ncbi:hypothetical protein MASR1M104_21610 [Cloacibacterium normanense]
MINISGQIYVKNVKIKPKLRPRLSGMFELSQKNRRFWVGFFGKRVAKAGNVRQKNYKLIPYN